MDNIGFIFTRYVNSKITNNYWKECYKCIRKYYNNQIIIIDDNSDYNFINPNDEKILENCIIIKSEFQQRGEILCYYYYYNLKPFEKAVIIHDSVFLNSKLDNDIIKNITDIKFLWHFDKTATIYDVVEPINILFNNLNNNSELFIFYNNKNCWNGCFGVQSIITYDFLEKIEEKYNLFNLMKCIKNRDFRMAFERVFGVLASIEKKELIYESSLFGNIFNHYKCFEYSYQDYVNNPIESQIIKIWSGR